MIVIVVWYSHSGVVSGRGCGTVCCGVVGFEGKSGFSSNIKKNSRSCSRLFPSLQSSQFQTVFQKYGPREKQKKQEGPNERFVFTHTTTSLKGTNSMYIHGRMRPCNSLIPLVLALFILCWTPDQATAKIIGGGGGHGVAADKRKKFEGEKMNGHSKNDDFSNKNRVSSPLLI
jgi:hypothetical protein